MLCLVIGAYCEGIGIIFRLVFRNNPHSQAVYILLYLFVVLSVCVISHPLSSFKWIRLSPNLFFSHVLSSQAITSSLAGWYPISMESNTFDHSSLKQSHGHSSPRTVSQPFVPISSSGPQS